MTAQVMDTLVYEDQTWSICTYAYASTCPRDCFPTSNQLGFETEMESTANYSGRVDQYEVNDGKLYLRKIRANLTGACRDFIPDNGGRETVTTDYWATVLVAGGVQRERQQWQVTNLLFNDLFIPFTGKILLGRRFDRNLYVHMGIQTANRFERRLILPFTLGLLDVTGVIEEQGAYPDEATPITEESK